MTSISEKQLSADFKAIAEEEFAKVKDKIAGKTYSDVTDDSGHQYVNLIQEGGGVWGIALIGYTYILEMAGIRFLKVAGTSAGAINTIFLAAMPNPQNGGTKSEKIVDLLAQLNFFSLVDGHWFARKLIKNLITNNGYAKQVAFSFQIFIVISTSLLFLSSILQWGDININRFALLAVILIGIIPLIAYLRARSNFNKENGETDKVNCDLNETGLTGSRRKGNKWKYATVSGVAIALTCLFSLGYSFNYLTYEYMRYLDLSLIFILIIGVIISHKKFDRDFLTLGTLLFVLLTVLSYGLGSLNIPVIQNHFYQLTIVGLGVCIIPFIIDKWIPHWLVYLLVLIGLSMFFLGLSAWLPGHSYSKFSYLSLVAVLLFTFLIVIVGGFLIYLYIKFSDSEFGVNPGDYFQCWVRDKLKEFNDGNDYLVEDLERIWKQNASGIRLKESRMSENPGYLAGKCESTTDDLKAYNSDDPPVVIISSDITSQNKAEFPKMKGLYWNVDDKVYVADFVRASMAIPFFFEPFKRTKIPQTEYKLWNTFFEYDFFTAPFQTAYFVDGGLLSNFPFNVFHNPAVKKARMATFGVRLDNLTGNSNPNFSGIFDYIGKMFNSGRGYYDRDFLLKNPYYRQCIKTVDLKHHNWLNFFVTDDEKKQMFRIGAEAACEFLKSFNWEKFQKERDAGVYKICNCD